jgi:DNA modification methylase
MILYCRKEQSRLAKEGQPDWIQAKPAKQKDRIHVYEKPLELMLDLVRRVAFPGCLVLDPFMGSGATISACINLNIKAVGIDIDKEIYTLTSNRIQKEILDKELQKEEK